MWHFTEPDAAIVAGDVAPGLLRLGRLPHIDHVLLRSVYMGRALAGTTMRGRALRLLRVFRQQRAPPMTGHRDSRRMSLAPEIGSNRLWCSTALLVCCMNRTY